MAKIKFTKYGVFKINEMILDVNYSNVEFGNIGKSVSGIETVRKVVHCEPIILWNCKGYLKELEGEA